MIDVTSDSIYIDDGSYSFEDVYSAVQDSMYRDQAVKAGDRSYYFDFDFYIGKNKSATLKDSDVNVEIDADYFQIYEGSEFIFGDKDNDEPTIGASIVINNPKLGYGFGCKDKDNGYSKSGNLELYGCYININCFWGFFNKEDTQVVKIKDCIVKGFGRVSGTDSFVDNVTCIQPEQKYGSFSTKGEIKFINNLKVVNATDDGYAFYFNPDLSQNSTVSNLIVKNCDNTIYCESSDDSYTLTLIDPDIETYNIEFEDNNSNVTVSYSLDFISSNTDIEVKIYASDDTLVDEFIIKNRTHTVLRYKNFNKDGDTMLNEYYFTIGDRKFPLTITQKQTMNLDLLLREEDVIINTSHDIYFLPKKVFELDNIVEFFIVCNKEITSVELLKNNFKTIHSADSIEEISSGVHKVLIVTGSLGEEGDNNEKWQDGPYLIKTVIDSNTYLKAIQLDRISDLDLLKEEIKIENKINDIESSGSGTVIYL